MAKSRKDQGMNRRGAEKRDVVINSYMPIDRMPMTLGHTGPVYYVPESDSNRMGYNPLAFRDKN